MYFLKKHGIKAWLKWVGLPVGGPCQHLHPNYRTGSKKSLSREEVREMDGVREMDPEGVGLADSHHVSKCHSHLPVSEDSISKGSEWGVGGGRSGSSQEVCKNRRE